MQVEIADGFLVVKVPLNPVPVRSKSEKTLLVASTHGGKPTAAVVNGQNVTVSLNAYIRA